MLFQTGKQIRICGFTGCVLGQNDNVYSTQCVAMLAKTFTANTADAVAIHSGRHLLFCNDKAKPGEVEFIACVQDSELMIAGTACFSEYLLEFCRPGKAEKTAITEASGDGCHITNRVGYGIKRARCLRRRRLSTKRPPLVAILARKP